MVKISRSLGDSGYINNNCSIIDESIKVKFVRVNLSPIESAFSLVNVNKLALILRSSDARIKIYSTKAVSSLQL